MSNTIDDLKPKPFDVTVKGVRLSCQPLRLSHAMIVARVGNIFQRQDATNDEIRQAEADIDAVIAEQIPELAETRLDLAATLELITQMMESVEPADNRELRERGVRFNADPKA